MLTSEAISPDKVVEKKGTYGAHSLGAATGMSRHEGGMTVTAEHGCLAVRVVRHGLIRVKLFVGAGAEAPGLDMGTTVAVVESAEEETAFKLRESKEAYFLETEAVSAIVDKSDCSIRFVDRSGRVVAHQRGMLWNEKNAVTGLFAASSQVRYYGLGEKTGSLDKKGERYEMWNSDVYAPHVPEIEALYQSIPLLIAHEPAAAYGVFLDNPGRTFFDMRSEEDGYLIQTETGSFDYYFIYGPQLKDVVGSYTSLTGRMELPPQWALGYHQSRYSYMSQEEVLELARTFREKQIPCDVIYLDIHYMEGYRVFTFDPERFPDPKAMIAELKEMGIRIVPIVDPGVKLDLNYEVFRDGAANGYFCRKQDGEPFVGPVWPGQSVFPDFTEDRVAEWWGDLHKFYTEMGIEGAWNDMNEPAVFNDSKTMDTDTVHGNNGNPVTHGEVHNLYGLLMSKATFEGIGRHIGGNRPFVLTRAGYAGIQRYAAVWTGDNRSFWEHMAMAMPMVLNLGLSGVSFAGPDIGGFAHHCSGELLARWTQMGALFPYCRNHSELRSIRQEPWSFGPDIEAICREYIGLRYRLMPLIYSVFRESAETGLPVIRPLVLEYPDDPNVSNLCDQFLLGSQLLAAPIYRAGTDHRSVYLPAGVWHDYWTGERLEGGRHVLAYAPLERMPLYVKEGAIIPHAEVAQSTAELGGADAASDVLAFDLYASGSSASAFEYYEDDGLTVGYREGAYNLHRLGLEVEQGSIALHVETAHAGFDGARGSWRLTFKQLPFAPSAVEGLPSGEDAWRFNAEANELTVTTRRPVEELRLVIHS
ncbi:glycoside hydrolase family 31 protein [Paenibacillus soyae]|uniref:Glycoside hydrolase family 31 protein n=1 Tax=Paenibacillus soyae TaxID=2969249 RepID=A0A9X2SD61_9BACL|nr:glycoside hydrolase family 31 protein [Paenibacillus soyae]MCR2806782.1 glycoside hydrolase family 31 protein [Paenibacillus soyae]